MFETRSYIVIEMDCISGGHLKKLLNKKLEEMKSQSPECFEKGDDSLIP